MNKMVATNIISAFLLFIACNRIICEPFRIYISSRVSYSAVFYCENNLNKVQAGITLILSYSPPFSSEVLIPYDDL